MIRINSYLHRNLFYDVVRRWMYNLAYPSDAELITRLVHFNNVYVSRYLEIFSRMVLEKLNGAELKTSRALLKADLKDVLVAGPPYLNERIEELIRLYRKHPERYYRATPFSGTLFFIERAGTNWYIGSNRIKRVRRLAEKSARRITDSIFEAIKRRADALADDRARRLGIPREQLVSRPEDMDQEFFKAEARLLEDLRAQRPIHFDEELIINDVAGLKVIAEDYDFSRVVETIRAFDNCEITEEEPHTGRYNAVNLIVRYSPPKKEILKDPLGPKTLKTIEARGLDPDRASREFTDFVNMGEDDVNIEVIVSNYQEMLESEIGRCMHEDRIIQQRLQQDYRGHLAKNVEYLMVYLFNFAVSARSELGQLPIQLWDRYLPDYFDEVIRSLFDLPPLRLVE
jgi:hypothetical protein